MSFVTSGAFFRSGTVALIWLLNLEPEILQLVEPGLFVVQVASIRVITVPPALASLKFSRGEVALGGSGRVTKV